MHVPQNLPQKCDQLLSCPRSIMPVQYVSSVTNACAPQFAPKMWPIVVCLCLRSIHVQDLSHISKEIFGNLPQKCDQLLCVFVSGLSFLCNIIYTKFMCLKFAPKMWPTVVRLPMMSIISCSICIIHNTCMCPKICPKNVTNFCLCPMSIMSCAICIICNKCMCSKICPKNVTNRCVSLSQVNH